jgi:hypothetical protein
MTSNGFMIVESTFVARRTLKHWKERYRHLPLKTRSIPFLRFDVLHTTIMLQGDFNPHRNNSSLSLPTCSHISLEPNHADQDSHAELYDILEALNSLVCQSALSITSAKLMHVSQTVDDPNDLEAHLIVDLARAKREVSRAEKLLADCVVREHEVTASLFRTRATTLEKKLDATDDELGRMRITCKNYNLIPRRHRDRDVGMSTSMT